jgi:CheY-specific phosphatase CheX
MSVKIDNTYVSPFINITKNIFLEMFGININPQIPAMIEPNEKNDWNISGTIGITACNVKGVIIINFKKITSTKVTKIIFGDDSFTEKEVIEMVSEIVNTIAGNATKDIGDIIKKDVGISLPTTTMSESGMQAHFPDMVKNPFSIPFEVENTNEIFELYIGFSGL